MAVLLSELAGDLESPESQRTGPEFGNFVHLICLTSGSCSSFQSNPLAHLLCARCYARPYPIHHSPARSHLTRQDWPWFVSGNLHDSCACLQQHSGPGLRPVTWSWLSRKHTQYMNTNVSQGLSLANQLVGGRTGQRWPAAWQKWGKAVQKCSEKEQALQPGCQSTCERLRNGPSS